MQLLLQVLIYLHFRERRQVCVGSNLAISAAQRETDRPTLGLSRDEDRPEAVYLALWRRRQLKFKPFFLPDDDGEFRLSRVRAPPPPQPPSVQLSV